MSYEITGISENQLRIIKDALDLYSRVRLGQIEEAFDAMTDRGGVDRVFKWETKSDLARRAKAAVGLQANSSWGVGHSEKTDTAIDLVDVIRHEMAWNRAIESGLVESKESPRDFSTMLQVDYDEPLQWGPESLITVSKKKDEE
jgi:hypothetical protein